MIGSRVTVSGTQVLGVSSQANVLVVHSDIAAVGALGTTIGAFSGEARIVSSRVTGSFTVNGDVIGIQDPTSALALVGNRLSRDAALSTNGGCDVWVAPSGPCANGAAVDACTWTGCTEARDDVIDDALGFDQPDPPPHNALAEAPAVPSGVAMDTAGRCRPALAPAGSLVVPEG